MQNGRRGFPSLSPATEITFTHLSAVPAIPPFPLSFSLHFYTNLILRRVKNDARSRISIIATLETRS